MSGSGAWTSLRASSAATVQATSVDGAAVSVLATGGHAGLVHATDATAARLDEMQFELGEGPTREAFERGYPVLIADLADLGSRLVSEWPVFAAAASEAGARAVFVVPLQLGAIRVGALLLYRRRPGDLDAAAFAAALRNADMVTVALVNLPRSAMAAAGNGGGTTGEEVFVDVEDAVYRSVVHQATGMVTGQLGVALDEALARMRAHAFAHDLPLAEVARSVVARSLRFEA